MRVFSSYTAAEGGVSLGDSYLCSVVGYEKEKRECELLVLTVHGSVPVSEGPQCWKRRTLVAGCSLGG